MVRKTIRKSVKRAIAQKSVSKKQYRVVMTVKVGPFVSKSAASTVASQVAKKGIAVQNITKAGKGYSFTTKVGYKCASAAVKKQVIAKLRAYAKQSGLSASAYKITA